MSNSLHEDALNTIAGQITDGEEPDPDWDEVPEEDEEDVISEAAHPPGFALLLSWLRAERCLQAHGQKGAALIQICAPQAVYESADFEALAWAGGCQLSSASSRRPRKRDSSAASDVQLVLLPPERLEAEAWVARHGAAVRCIGLWCSESAEPLSGVPASRCLKIDLFAEPFRPFLIRHLWQQWSRQAFGEEVALSTQVFEELQSLPREQVLPVLHVLLSEALSGGDLQHLPGLAMVEQTAWLADGGMIWSEPESVREWVLETLCHWWQAQHMTVLRTEEDRLQCVMTWRPPRGIRFELECSVDRFGQLLLVSRSERRFEPERVAVLMGAVNDWNQRAGLCAAVVSEESALLVTLSTTLEFSPGTSRTWARQSLLKAARQICEFWLLSMGVLLEGGL
ncbi:hypothetical protein SAMN05660284_01989 [Formivibrio citricus]|uniref:Uncharacterized protein n=1 Tax=Formivibrio citricus TaxID=83765 RepID=A0A1I5ATN8_9NEIS|nr:hypothetical protein [Formivibrio citricus]SFN65794.1 hypothetical protein SAMN05660284_01989 [Formivibrio citricus]